MHFINAALGSHLKREAEVQKVRRRAPNELIPFVSNYKHFVDFSFLARSVFREQHSERNPGES